MQFPLFLLIWQYIILAILQWNVNLVKNASRKMNAKNKKSLCGILIYQDVSWEKFNGYFITLNLLTPRRTWVSSLNRNFNSISRKDHQKNFLRALRLWVGRRKELILRYICPEKRRKNLVHKGLNAIVACCRRRKQHNRFIYLSSAENSKIKI